ncbi:site-specific integrase [Vibrio parahaemolyticus]|nr:site-specific integrase [Vibrio parahaemolyticus]EGR0656102.1 site-specific integrase [Vibrio parahaemolyticus]EGR0703435.1 site-specific integrase [Vibrio parahaemolyticus]EGR0888570.1 site-specific integrase [Vibrio parahaemolyticus]EIW4959655.1 site-specific integrase [Vibrio parahaemolyticus]
MSNYEYIRLREGLAIYKQKQSKNFYVYLKTEDGDFRCSLKTDDKEEATTLAYSYYFSYTKNLTPEIFEQSKSSVSKICDELIKNFDKHVEETGNKKSQQALHSSILKNVIKPTFGKLKVKQLDALEMKKVIETASSKTTLSNQRKCFKHIFDYAVENRLMKSYEVPDIPSASVKSPNPRASFSDELLLKIKDSFPSFIDAANGRKALTRQYRLILREMCSFMLLTGVRPGEEILSLNFSTLERIAKNNSYAYSIKIDGGKTKNYEKGLRRISICSVAFAILQKLAREIHGIDDVSFEDLKRNNIYAFRPTENDKKPDFSKIFDQFIKHSGIDSIYSLYSFRHTYITNKLLEGVQVYLVAKHCGTSVAMIEQYYDKLETTLRATELVSFTPFVKVDMSKS